MKILKTRKKCANQFFYENMRKGNNFLFLRKYLPLKHTTIQYWTFIKIEDNGLKDSNAYFSRSIIPLFGISEIILEIPLTDLILSNTTFY